MDEMLAQDYLEKSASENPLHTALIDSNKSITFQDLADISDRLAKLLLEAGIKTGDHVAHYMKRRAECIIASAGILKVGAVYIPLDGKTPHKRLHQIIADSEPKVIICDDSTLPSLVELRATLPDKNFTLISADKFNSESSQEVAYFLEDILLTPPIRQQIRVEPDDVAHIIYTSGSTGTPKGVMITHRNIRNYIDWGVRYFKITNHDRILGTAPFHFDMSTFDIWCALSAGATLCLATGNKLLFPEYLARFIEDENITIWKGVSSLLMYMCRAKVVQPGRMNTLRTVIFAGEPLAAQYLAEWMEAFPQTNFYNGYGPTEATGVSLCYHVPQVPKPGEKIPIGYPCKGAKVVVLGDDGIPVPQGEIGELCISGDGLAKGYLHDQEKTDRQFTRPPADLDIGSRIYHTGDLVQEKPTGEFVFISRKDQQIKWMGYRIELGEIETNLMAHPEIKDAVVLLIEKNDRDISILTAFYESNLPITAQSLSTHLSKLLPKYMVPKKFIHVENLPRNDRGKISRRDLLDWYQMKEQPEYA